MINVELFEYSETTNSVRVSVKTSFDPEKSRMDKSIFWWLYKVRIENFNNYPIKITGRYWQVFDENGQIEDSLNAGLLGDQPVIKSKELLEYTSKVSLFNDSGLMRGQYYIVGLDESHREFTVNIPAFSLDVFTMLKRAN